MAGKSDTFENDLLKLIFNATAITGLAQNHASPLTNLYFSLHTADPTDAGNQSSNEANYTGYLREPVARTSTAFSVTGNVVYLAANLDFDPCSTGSNTVTHFAVGTAATAGTATGKILYAGTVTPNISVSNGVTPRLTTGTNITED